MSYIYFVQMDIPDALDAELNRIYDTEHVPMLSKVPGVSKRDALSAGAVERQPDAEISRDLRDRLARGRRRQGMGGRQRLGRLGSENPPAHDEPPPQLFREVLRAGKGRDAGAPYIYVVQMDIPAAHEAEFNRVYDAEHAPMLVECCGGANPLPAGKIERQPDAEIHGDLRDRVSPAVTETKEWADAGALGDWATKIRPHTTSRHHTIFKKIRGGRGFPDCDFSERRGAGGAGGTDSPSPHVRKREFVCRPGQFCLEYREPRHLRHMLAIQHLAPGTRLS